MINKAFRVTTPSKIAYRLAFGALLVLLFAGTPANSAFQCTQCPENFYCTGGQKLACPAEKPVTGKLGATECLECHQIDNAATPVNVNGACLSCYDSSKDSANVTHVWKNNTCMACDVADENYPAFVEGEGCVTCAQANGNDIEFFWDKTAKYCVSCKASDNMTWDTAAGTCGCVDGYYENLGIEIKRTDGTSFYLTKNSIFTASSFATDNLWLASIERCTAQGKRLPTLEELLAVKNTVYSGE